MSSLSTYEPHYQNSWALVIGINQYQYTSNLQYARHDAEAVAKVLKDEYSFDQDKVTLLLDSEASRDAIMDCYLGFSNQSDSNDRVIIFFAGHGHTQRGNRSETGYLVPVDGDIKKLNTLIRWDEFTRNADLIPAKHILFIMDACYSGLALQRNALSGHQRFLKNMLQRYSRQVLTAGKADEPVDDGGGPRPNHSIFTGHLLDALDGKARVNNDAITANQIMAYVYKNVAQSPNSRQTPHYGTIDGDGDFVFEYEKSIIEPEKEENGSDIVIEIPSSGDIYKLSEYDLIEMTKEYISESRMLIKLDDLINKEIKLAKESLRDIHLDINYQPVSPDEFVEKIYLYEEAMERLIKIVILLSKWGGHNHRPIVQKIFTQLTEGLSGRNATNLRLSLRWYPIELLIYASGISSVSADRYDNLNIVLNTEVLDVISAQEYKPVMYSCAHEILELDRQNLFKRITGHENYKYPRSEYLFNKMQSALEDMLFLGSNYEVVFDKFEILYALSVAVVYKKEVNRSWGPVGRFGYKSIFGDGLLGKIINEGISQGRNWEPIKAGLFNGSEETFKQVSTEYLGNFRGRSQL